MLKGHVPSEEFEKLRKSAAKLRSADFLAKSLKLVKCDPDVLVSYEHFDRSVHLINLKNGTFDLIERKIRNHDPSDYLTSLLDFDYKPDAKCPLMEELLKTILGTEQSLFLMRVFGYALSGKGNERKFLIFQGTGRNGKSTVTKILSKIFGSMWVSVQPETLNGKLNGQIRNDLARIAGSRVMITNETNSGSVLDAPLLKQITGGEDAMTARYLNQEYFEFIPRCLPIIVSNYLPVIDGGDKAIAERACLIIFDMQIVNPDVNFGAKLDTEISGIFNLLLDGFYQYQEIGLSVPDCVKERTLKYVDRSNLIKSFFDDCLVEEEGRSIHAAQLQRCYQDWCKSNGYKPMSANVFKEAFERDTGIIQKRLAEGRVWSNLKLTYTLF